MKRRDFLRSSGTAFLILQSGSARTYAANEKLDIASIGAGGKAAGDIEGVSSQNIVALCDVDQSQGARMFQQYPKARRYKDYRVMIEEMAREIDAVIVATPDHHHFHASMLAIRAGKHVYTEKPLTHSVWEARELTRAARQAGVATQMGNQAQAHEETRRVQEYIQAGVIGPVREVHIWTDRASRGLFDEYWPQGIGRPKDQPDIPAHLDWDLWLGPAPERAYHSAYLPFKWRGWWDFGTGALGDIACHFFDPVFRALKIGAPLTIEASSSRVNTETYPMASMITYDFPAREIDGFPPVRLTWYDGGLRPPRPREVPDGAILAENGLLLIGENGVLFSDWNKWRLYPDSLNASFGEPSRRLERSPGHYLEWILACKGGKPAGSNFDWAGPMTETVLLGNIALRAQLREKLTRARLTWDSANFAFTNLPEANQWLRREYRDGWRIQTLVG
ncbi:MAG: Gfo/Idh/MocA family oxidoreductase [Verrucomicrobia bacterium]|nr:Gfo/Idh/MocA family oxidoreductase [Verrucomicrobiota bacterium]